MGVWPYSSLCCRLYSSPYFPTNLSTWLRDPSLMMSKTFSHTDVFSVWLRASQLSHSFSLLSPIESCPQPPPTLSSSSWKEASIYQFNFSFPFNALTIFLPVLQYLVTVLHTSHGETDKSFLCWSCPHPAGLVGMCSGHTTVSPSSLPITRTLHSDISYPHDSSLTPLTTPRTISTPRVLPLTHCCYCSSLGIG